MSYRVGYRGDLPAATRVLRSCDHWLSLSLSLSLLLADRM